MKYFLPLFAVSMLAISFGCNNSTSTSSGPTIVIPNAGSSWTYQNTFRDSIGTVKKIDTSTRVIAATNMTIQGYSDVAMIVETNTATKVSDTVYLRYLSTGDISRLSSPALDPALPEWLTVPYYTHNAQAFSWGGTISEFGYTHDSIMFSAAFVQNENDTVAGVVYPASVITSTTWHQSTSAGKDSTGTITQTNSFIASKGIFGNRNVTMNEVNGKQVQIQQQVLIGVSLK